MGDGRVMETIRDMAQAVRGGKVSAEQCVQDSIDRLERWNPRLGAFLSTDGRRALVEARKVDAAHARGETLGPLAGVPMALKDNHCTSFGATTCGSRILESFRSPYDAHVVERLESAGAIVIGKTNLDEFAMGSSTENSAFGPTRNPWDLERVAGGSSGGSAAAVAARIVPGALGSDTGGSIRLPASFCGVVGLKPTYGRVSRYGLVAFGSSLDQIGPIANCVEDVAALLGVIAGHDPRDSTSVSEPVPNYLAALNKPLNGLRIGISEEYFGEGLNAEVRAAVREAIEIMVRAGAQKTTIHLPHMKYGVACYYLIATAEASSNLARFDGVRYGHRTARPTDIFDLYLASRGEGFGAEVKRRIMLGTFALSSGYYEAYYEKALRVRTLIRRDFERAFAECDFIASPVAPTTAFRVGEKSSDPLAMYLGDVYTISANLAGICALSMPCGFDGRGLPIGLQLMGPAYGEESLLAAAYQLQGRTEWHQRRPPDGDSTPARG
jgi:aspartyl-tRNA(Asn)/glutamyl-tRNA(Gln) amidotransferase subunit A